MILTVTTVHIVYRHYSWDYSVYKSISDFKDQLNNFSYLDHNKSPVI